MDTEVIEPLPEFLSAEGVAKLLGVSKRTIFRYMRNKKNPLPFISLSDHTIRIPYTQLQLWISSRVNQEKVRRLDRIYLKGGGLK